MSRKTVMIWCPAHGRFDGNHCPKCAEHTDSMNIITHDWVTKTEFEHIDPTQPRMRFDSKRELIKACEKRGLLVRAFMKPKSRGVGYKHKK